MTRAELRTRFRNENPEITDRVISDAVLSAWMIVGNLEICTITRCIVSNALQNIQSVDGQAYYDLETITNFLDIDDMPGGGVYYEDNPLKKASPGEMNLLTKNWRAADEGTPTKWWRRGKYLWLYPTPDTSAEDIDIECILKPNSWTSDVEGPFNNLGHLESYHDGISKYLQWRCKEKIGKLEEAQKCKKDYIDYVQWMKKMVSGYSKSAIFFKPSDR